MERGTIYIWLSRTEQPAVRNFAIEKITEFVEEDISDISSSFLLREGDLLEGTMVSRSLQRLVQEMHATPFASLSTHEQSIYTRIEDASTSLDVHIAGMVLLSPGCFKHSHENCNPPYEICTGKSSARCEVTEEQKELWRSAFNILLTMLQYVFFKFLRISSCHQTFLRCYSSESQHVQVILRYFFCLFTQFPDALHDQPLYVRLCTELKGVIARTSSHKAVPSSPFSFPVDAISTVFTILQERCMDSLFWSVFGLDSTERVTRTKDLSLIKLMQESARFSSVSQLNFFPFVSG